MIGTFLKRPPPDIDRKLRLRANNRRWRLSHLDECRLRQAEKTRRAYAEGKYGQRDKWRGVKGKARKKVSEALLYGKLVRPMLCSRCNKECKPHGHHPDYSKPLEVIWLCSDCHALEHIVLRGRK